PAGPYSTPEGTAVQLSGTALGLVGSYAWDLNNDGIFETAGQTVFFTPTDNGPHTVTLRANGTGGPGTNSVTVNVSNLPPSVAINSVGLGAHGQPMVFTFTASDPSLVDQSGQFTFHIDWNGDNTIDEIVTGPNVRQLTHTFTELGVFDVKVKA